MSGILRGFERSLLPSPAMAKNAQNKFGGLSVPEGSFLTLKKARNAQHCGKSLGRPLGSGAQFGGLWSPSGHF